MMDEERCDRCGCIIENEDTYMYLYGCLTLDNECTAQFNCLTGHLCEDCRNDLDEFMQGKEETEETETGSQEEPHTNKFVDMPMQIKRADEYQSLAMRTCCICNNDKDKLMHGVLGLTSEAGEVAGIFQKVYQGHPDPTQDKEAEAHLVKECGDCLWMIAEILDAVHASMSDCMTANIQKLRARYPDGFEPDKSLHRKAGDV